MRIFRPTGAPLWLEMVLKSIERGIREVWPAPFRLKSYAKASLPDAADYTGALIYVTDEIGGAVPAFSDGTNWRRVTDRAIVS